MIDETLNSYELHLKFLRRMVADVDDHQMVCQPISIPNHPAWIVGHLAFSLQQIAGECGVSPWLPEDWEGKFGTGSIPVAAPSVYPDKESLLGVLEDSKERLWSAIRSLGEAGLAKLLPDVRYRDRFPTVAHAVVHILSGHTALHLGQLTVWRRLMNLEVTPEPLNEPRLEITPETPTSPDAAKLIAELTKELAGQYDHAPDGTGDFRPEEEIPRSVFLVGRLGRVAIACGAIRPLEGDVAEVKRMFVQQEHRGQGLSKQILVALEDAAIRLGYVSLRLETGDRQQAAIGLYEKAGFHRSEPFGIYIGNEHSVCFEKHISPKRVEHRGTTGLLVRPYREVDEAAVVGLWGIVFPNPPSWNVPTEDIRRKLSVQPELFLVAQIDGRVVGTTMAGFDGHRGWLHLVAVHPDNQRQGIGQVMMLEAERRLQELGCTKVNLQVRSTNTGVVAFYENLGYTVEDRLSLGKRLEQITR